MSEMTDVVVMLHGFAEDLRKSPAASVLEAQLRFEQRELIRHAAEVVTTLRTKLTQVEQERKELKAANVSAIQLATDNAKWCIEAKDRAEAAEQDRDRLAADLAETKDRIVSNAEEAGLSVAALEVENSRLAAEVGSLHIELASVYAVISGKQYHMSDCATSCAPAERPARCDCDAPVADLGLLIRQLRKGQHFTVDSMACLMREAATAIQAQLAQLTAAQEENKRLEEQNADLLAALQIVKEQRQLWWGKAVHRGRELTAAQQSAQEQRREGKELLDEALKLCCCKDGDGDFLHPSLAIRINLHLATIQAELSKGEEGCKGCTGYPVCVEANIPAEPCHAYDSTPPPRTYEQGAEEALEALGHVRIPNPRCQARYREAAIFKNFHRSLCERFGYSHDERDYARDLVSLEEHIASQLTTSQAAEKDARDYEQWAEVCEWVEDVSTCSGKPVYFFETTCEVQINASYIHTNGFKVCPYCAKTIAIRALPTQPEGEGE